MAAYRIQPLTREEARQILDWRYAPPFDYYDPPLLEDTEPLLRAFLEPENGFHGVRDDQNRFIGFCSYGFDGRVLGGHYDGTALDIGLGMKPEMTSHGKGNEFFRAIMAFAYGELGAENLRLTVADFNDRAQRVYARAGFEVVDHFLDALDAVPHTIMLKPALRS